MTVDLRTRYLGLDLRSPLVCSSSPLHGRARDGPSHGARPARRRSCCRRCSRRRSSTRSSSSPRALEAGTNQFAEALDYFPSIDSIPSPSDRYVELIALYKRELDIPVIASLNAATPGGWVRYARQIQEAGADALELNLYHLVADPRMTAADRERMDLDLIRAVCAVVTIPVTVKLSPFYSALAGFAMDAVVHGRRRPRPVQPLLPAGPGPRDARRREQGRAVASVRAPGPLRWIAILRPLLGPGISLAATSGVHSGTDAVKALLVGADVAMMTSALLRHGPEFVATVERELVEWLDMHDYESVAQLRGAATKATVGDPTAFERANYMATLHSWSSPPELATR